MNQPDGFTISNWKLHEKNTLRGFFSVTLPSGMILHGCSLHAKGESQWIAPPSQKFVKTDGSVTYTPVIEFDGADAHRKFQAAVLRAVNERLAGGK